MADLLAGRAPVAFASPLAIRSHVESGKLVALGVTGLYVGRIFEETKGRPLYVVKETVNVTNFHSATGGGGYNAPGDVDEASRGGRKVPSTERKS